MTLTIVGLGPGDEKYLSVEALALLEATPLVLTRTLKHPTVNSLSNRVKFESFDALYEEKETFDEVYQAIAEQIVQRLEKEDVVYAVPGNPFIAEKTVELLKKSLKNDVKIIHGTSFMDVLISKIGFDPTNGLRLINALNLPTITSNSEALLLIQCYDKIVASEAKIWLSQAFKDEQDVMIIRAIGTADEEIVTLPLYQIDSYDKYDHLTSILVLPEEKTIRRDFASLVDIVAYLRSDNGCAWDRAQTHQSVKGNFLEEAYEVAEAIENEDIYGLEEELGDMLLQVLFHAQIAKENGDFRLEDVVEGIADKLVIRHPHVYGEQKASTASEAHQSWDKMKMTVNNQKTIADVMGKYTRGLPATFRTQKIANKAKKAGFKWQTEKAYLEKIEEELKEVKAEFISGNKSELSEELGDLLYAIVAFINILGFSSDELLHNAGDKFIQRFARLEKKLIAKNRSFSDLDEAEIISLWQAEK